MEWGGRGWGAEGLANQHFNYMKAIVFYLECELMKLISLCGMNPLACQIIARGSDSASQFLSPLLQRRRGEERKTEGRRKKTQTTAAATNRVLSLRQAGVYIDLRT